VNRVSDLGTVDITTTGAKIVTASLSLTAGVHYLAVSVSATATLVAHDVGRIYGNQSAAAAGNVRTSLNHTMAYGPYPATVTPVGTGGYSVGFARGSVRLT